MTPAEIAKLTVPKLKAELAERGLDETGLKKDLVDRLTAALAEPAVAAAPVAAPPSRCREGHKMKRAAQLEDGTDQPPGQQQRTEAAFVLIGTKEVPLDTAKGWEASVAVAEVEQQDDEAR